MQAIQVAVTGGSTESTVSLIFYTSIKTDHNNWSTWNSKAPVKMGHISYTFSFQLKAIISGTLEVLVLRAATEG